MTPQGPRPPFPQDAAYLRPGAELVVRIQDDMVAGGPESTLFVGIVSHAAAVFDGLVGNAGQRNVLADSERCLLTVQRWDVRSARWRKLDARERGRFDAVEVGE